MAGGQLDGVVALDGPSGTGKSTVARELARRTGAGYLDTGAMYRAMTLAVLRAGVPPTDADQVIRIIRAATLRIVTDPDNPKVSLDDVDVAAEIRGAEVTSAVSAVSAVPEVRELLVREQREIIARVSAAVGGIVVEGRDIGTVVAPEARLKVYLTASADTRAQRRSTQDTAAGRSADLAATRADVQRRDQLDSTRASSPLRAAEDALVLDTTELDVAGVLAELTELIESRGMVNGAEAAARD
ncbi:cytidylate kinase [Tamaricihabitans halophyticus]|uniref:Cytidylate kinase n=1 Tax=Tamaricihabitans halophyticus TaxID=1262583 RepID=A0A4V2SQJ0_9PSEU|nr:(d)CMP kinase [Tamaricihabitans halophyticus]TCP39206.1 cytidylate kinase [Tamaricihabitans halophyticus]